MKDAEKQVELHLGIVQRIAFLLLKLSYHAQSIFSEIYWRTIGTFFLYAGYLLCGRRRGKAGKEYKSIVFKEDIKLHHYYGIFLSKVMIFNGQLNGLKSRYDAYEFLISWNPSIPLIALESSENSSYIIERLGKEYADKKGWFPVIDVSWLGTSKRHGYFRVVTKSLDNHNPSRVRIECIWLTGPNKGERFIISLYGTEKASQHLPDSIYFPPRIIVWCFEALISLSAFLAIWGLTSHLYTYILVSDTYAQLKSLLSFIARSIN